MVAIKGKESKVNLDLQQDSYFLKVKHVFQDGPVKNVYINNNILYLKKDNNIRIKGIMETDSIYIPKKYVLNSGNVLKIYFSGSTPNDVDITVSNYRKKLGKDLYLLYRDSRVFSSNNYTDKACVAILVLTFLAAMVYLLNKFLNLKKGKLFLYLFYCTFPFLFLLSLFLFQFGSYRLYSGRSYLMNFGLICFLSLLAILILNRLFLSAFKGVKCNKYGEIANISRALFVNSKLDEAAKKFAAFIIAKRLSSKLILIFMASLMVSFLFIIMNLNSAAEFVSYFGFFALVIGIGTIFYNFICEGSRKVKNG